MATSTRRTTTTVQTASPCAVSQHQKSDEELLTDLFSAYYEARKNKRSTYSQMRFESHLSRNIVSIWDDIRHRKYNPGRSMCFIINDPVQREVFAASFRDRVVHHLLYNYISPLLEKSFIEDSYSCRVGKGNEYGVKRLMWHMSECLAENPGCEPYVLKLDIQGYFMNIDRQRLYAMVTAGIHGCDSGLDCELTDYLLRCVIFNDATKGCRIKGSISDWDKLPESKSLFNSPPGCGLPIGNLTSQLFSNVYLDSLDKFVTDELGFNHYGRYVDDFFIVSSDKNRLLAAIPAIRSFLTDELGLTLHPNKIYLQPVHKGVKFLGFWVFPECASILYSARHRINSHMIGAITDEVDPYLCASILKSCHNIKEKRLANTFGPASSLDVK